MGLYDELFGNNKVEDSDRCAPKQVMNQNQIRGDGVYYLTVRKADGSIECYMCLRFFPEQKKVVQGSFYKDLPRPELFTSIPDGMSTGLYTRDGNSIRFTTVSRYGRVEYHGVLLENSLLLSSHSFINGHEAHDRTYSFICDDELAQIWRAYDDDDED